MGALGTPFILTVTYFGLVTTILLAMRSATNALLAGAYLAPFFVAAPACSVVVLFADTQTVRTVFNKRVLMCNFVFSVLILAIGIVYYDFFHHLSEIPR
jgi:hypothetical protein